MRPLLVVGGLVALLAAPALAADRPVVVELFTSQGCSSCPPAEALFVDLTASRSDVLALAFHVDYWDRLGWKDPFSSAAATARQERYAARIGGGGVYTPQIVVDGRAETLGSDRGAVQAKVAAARASAGRAVPVRLTREGGALGVTVGAGDGAATLLLVGYDPRQRTAVGRGENAGRTILQANVVRSVERIGEWRGGELKLTRPKPAGERVALLLQTPDGRILGAARLD